VTVGGELTAKRKASAKQQANAGNHRPSVQFSPVTGTSPAPEIVAQIREHLASRRLKAGDRLPSERDLALQFRVSRNSLRQALRSLVDSGLLQMKKGATGGAFIRDGGGEAVATGLSDLYSLGTIRPEHLTEARIIVGVEVARLACVRATDAEIDELEANVAAAEQAASSRNYALRTELNLVFYELLARMTRNPILATVTDAVIAITRKYVDEVGRTSNQSVMPFRRRFLEKMRARECEEAAELVRVHLLNLQEIYLRASRKDERDRSTPDR
jgi:DNA-binding FadR family transcriptional regulator